MFVSQLLVAALTATYVRATSSFQPGSDYNVHPTTNLYNCTGSTPVSDVTARNAPDSLPQINPSSGRGWEQWSLYLHGTPQVLMRWNKGDPSSSKPQSSHFDILITINGSTIQSSVEGALSYTNKEDVMQIAIGDNSLLWDSDALWFNASVNIDGYQIEMNSNSATLDSLHPNVASYNGLLDQSGGWFGSVPLIRAHVYGTYTTPTTASAALNGLSVMRHMFSEEPLPSYISQYTGGTIWGYSTNFYDNHVFYQTETTNGTVHTAAYLGRGLPTPGIDGDWSSAWATYAVTDDQLYSLSIEPSGIDVSFSGCANTNNIPWVFNTTSLTLFGSFTDLGGGVTRYYTTVDGSATGPFNGAVANGSIAAFFEEYVAP